MLEQAPAIYSYNCGGLKGAGHEKVEQEVIEERIVIIYNCFVKRYFFKRGSGVHLAMRLRCLLMPLLSSPHPIPSLVPL